MEDNIIGPELQITKCILNNPQFCKNKTLKSCCIITLKMQSWIEKHFGLTFSYKLILKTYFRIADNLSNYCSKMQAINENYILSEAPISTLRVI